MIRSLFFMFLVALLGQPVLAESPRGDVMRVLHMLDYIGVDYPEFVRDGQILDALEYEEQRNFSAAILQRLDSLPVSPRRQGLIVDAQTLALAIEQRVDGQQIKQMTTALSAAVLASYPVPLAPRQPPDLSQAAALFDTHCSACHGTTGLGDGPAGVGLEPAPTNFHDVQRQRQRSVFGLYNVISNGVPDTGMPSFRQFPDQQRWALAFHAGQLIYDKSSKDQGRKLYKSGYTAGLDNLAALSNTPPDAIEAAQGEKGLAVMAYLRSEPGALAQLSPLALARSQVNAAGRAWQSGQKRAATDAALAAYLDGYEMQEAAVVALDADLNAQIEASMLGLRQAIERGAPVSEVQNLVNEADGLLAEAQDLLNSGSLSASGVLVGSFIILTREGLEALLVLAALFAFLNRVDRRDALPYVHAGWISAIVAGVLTWFAASHLITISGASRELTEGISALIAAVVLLSVGLWMHSKSLSGQWQQYIARKMKGSLDGGRVWGLAALAFIATYREVFETVLFYQALWNQGHHGALLAGFALGCVALVGLAVVILRASYRLPLEQFFFFSALLVIVLAIIFTGQGMQALQEAGAIGTGKVSFISIPLLGIYPNWQGLLAQATLVVIVGFVLIWTRRSAEA